MADVFKPKEDKYYTFRPFRVPKYNIKFERAAKLSDVPGYVWYSPAAIYLWGRYTETNLADVIRETEAKIFWHKFDKPIFKGFGLSGDSAWNHTLWAAEEAHGNKIYGIILETVQFDIPNKRLYQYAMQKLNVYDPLTHDTEGMLTTKTPQVEVNVFAVLSNVGQFAFDVRKLDNKKTPGMVTFKPDPIHVKAANRLFDDPKLNQDKAFERYKQIMVDAQRDAYERERKKVEDERKQ